MKILKSWLQDWVDIEKITGDVLSEALESLGFEIESRTDIKPNYKNIVVGKVIDIYPHPNADKVRVTKGRARGTGCAVPSSGAIFIVASPSDPLTCQVVYHLHNKRVEELGTCL